MQNEENTEPFAKVAECLYRNTSSKRYYALVKKSGKQIRRSLKTNDRKLADRRLRELREQIERLDPKKGQLNITFDELAMTWLRTQAPHLKDSSYRRRELSIRQVGKFFRSANIRNITRSHCEKWAQKRSPGISASTFNNERETLIRIFDYAEREGIILNNPARILKRRKARKTQVVIPSKEEFQMLIRTMRDLDCRYWNGADLVELLAYSGMRLGEAAEITWRDIDFARDMFTVTGGNTGTKNHEARTVPLFPILKGFLKRIRKEQELTGTAPSPDSRIAGTRTAKKAINAASKKAELPHFNHHCMRHYFVSNAIEKGVDFKTIAAWVGHKDGGLLVAETYGHLRDSHSFEMAKLMAD
jgi:integrase